MLTWNDRLDRRSFTRLLGGAAAAVAAGGVLPPRDAAASIGWCRSDPLITVNGKTGHVYVDSTEAMLASATGAIKIEILVPVGSSVDAVPLDNGFGWGYDITFKEDKKLAARGSWSEVRIKAKAPALDGSLPVRVTVHADDPNLADATRTGYANEELLTGGVKI